MDRRARRMPGNARGVRSLRRFDPGCGWVGCSSAGWLPGRPPDRAHLPLARSSPRSFSPGDRRPRALGAGRRRASGLPVAVDGRGRAGLGSWALPPRPVRSAAPAVPRRWRPILPWASILFRVSGTPGACDPPLPVDRGLRRRARTGCESVPATSARDRSRPRSAHGLVTAGRKDGRRSNRRVTSLPEGNPAPSARGLPYRRPFSVLSADALPPRPRLRHANGPAPRMRFCTVRPVRSAFHTTVRAALVR